MEHYRRRLPPPTVNGYPKAYSASETDASGNGDILKSPTAATAIAARSLPASLSDKTRVDGGRTDSPLLHARSQSRRLEPHQPAPHRRRIDVAVWDVNSFKRRLDMKEGISYRDIMEVTSPQGNQLRIHKGAHLQHGPPRPLPHQIQRFIHQLCRKNLTRAHPRRKHRGRCRTAGRKDMEHPAFRFHRRLRLSLDTDPEGRRAGVLCHDLPVIEKRQGNHGQPHKDRKRKADRIQRGNRRKTRRQSVTLIKYVAIASSLYNERSMLVELSVGEARKAKNTGWTPC